MNSITASPSSNFTRREWLFVAVFAAILLIITGIPYFYAHRIAPPDSQFVGVIFNVPDHFQYFSWMRESQTQILVPNQLTPEYSTPLLFNLLWWTLGRIEALTGLSYITLYQLTRLLAGAFTLFAIYYFCGLVFQNRLKRWTAFLVASLGTGIGWIWVVEKYLSDRPDVLNPFTIYTAEPNTFYSILAYPHFTVAIGLIALIFSLVLLAQRHQSLRYAWVAAAVTLVLSLQHSYDMFTIYGVIGLYGLFLWRKKRKFPVFMFKTGLIIALVSVWPALQAFLITNADPVWKGVLSQFDNAGAWTPQPHLLPVLMGFGWLLAIWAIDFRTPFKDRDDTHLFVLAWFVAHFPLIYLPLNFQIHLLSGWQVVIGVLATIGLYRRVLPLLERLLKNTPRRRLVLIATGLLLVLVVPTNLYILAQRFIDVRRAESGVNTASADNARGTESFFFLSNGEAAAFRYLEGQVGQDDVVFASLNMGQFVPALTGARSFLGHWAQTLDFFGKRDMVAEFYDPATSDSRREEILNTYGVDYLLYTQEEKRLGGYNPADAPFLLEVFSEDGAQVFAVATPDVL